MASNVPIWKVTDLGLRSYLAERYWKDENRVETYEGSDHCLQCFKSQILAKKGGRIDLRGSHKTLCGAFLRVMQQTVKEEKDA